MGWEQLVEEAGSGLGLQKGTSPSTAFGFVEGFPAQLSLVKQERSQSINVELRFAPGADFAGFSAAIEQAFSTSAEKFSTKRLTIEDGTLHYRYDKGLFGNPTVETIRDQIRRMAEAIKHRGARPPTACDSCGGSSSAPVLINTALALSCDHCITGLKEKADQEARAYESRTVNYPLVTLAGLAAAVLGAAIWGAIIIATETMYAAVAGLNGLIVGAVVIFLAKKKTVPVQAIAVGLTIVSVVLGNVVYFAYLVQQGLAAQGDSVDWLIFAAHVPGLLLEDLSNTVFAAVCGLVGAVVALKMSQRFSRPSLTVERLAGS